MLERVYLLMYITQGPCLEMSENNYDLGNTSTRSFITNSFLRFLRVLWCFISVTSLNKVYFEAVT